MILFIPAILSWNGFSIFIKTCSYINGTSGWDTVLLFILLALRLAISLYWIYFIGHCMESYKKEAIADYEKTLTKEEDSV